MEFVMQRDFVVATRHGHAIEFKKGEPTHVPDVCWPDVQQHGAVPVEELPTPTLTGPNVPQGTARATAIAAAMQAIVDGARREDFTAGGAPHAAAVSAACGFTVDANERDVAWAALQQA